MKARLILATALSVLAINTFAAGGHDRTGSATVAEDGDRTGSATVVEDGYDRTDSAHLG